MTYQQSGVLNPYLNPYVVPHIIVYTRGSCTRYEHSSAKAGIGGYFGPNNIMNFSDRCPGRQTSIAAEIHAARRAIWTVKNFGQGHRAIIIRTHSDFLKMSIERWLPVWKINGFRRADGQLITNWEEFQVLDCEMQNVWVRFEQVSVFSGDNGTTEAEKLALEGAKKTLKSFH